MGNKIKRPTILDIQKKKCGQFIRGKRIEWAGYLWWSDGSMLIGALTDIMKERRKIWKDSLKGLLEKIEADWKQAYDRG